MPASRIRLAILGNRIPSAQTRKKQHGTANVSTQGCRKRLTIKSLLYEEGFTIPGARQHSRSEIKTDKKQSRYPFRLAQPPTSNTFVRDCATFSACSPPVTRATRAGLSAEASVKVASPHSSVHIDQFDFVAIAIKSNLRRPTRLSAIGTGDLHGESVTDRLLYHSVKRDIEITTSQRYRRA